MRVRTKHCFKYSEFLDKIMKEFINYENFLTQIWIFVEFVSAQKYYKNDCIKILCHYYLYKFIFNYIKL